MRSILSHWNGFRTLSLSVLAAAFFLIVLCMSAGSAEASWSGYKNGQNCVPDGSPLGGTCETVADACESWALYRTTWVRRIEHHYDSNGQITGATCVIRHFLAVGQDFRDPTYPSCPAGYEVNGNAASGCQLAVPERALGQCDKCRSQSLAGMGDPDLGPTVGNPISLATGNKFQAVTDYRSGGAHPLSFTRYYNSQSKITGVMGPAWRHGFERRLAFVSGSRTNYYAADGKVYIFNKVGSDWQPDSDVVLSLSDSGGEWSLKDKYDRLETFDSNGRLTGIVAKDGYRVALEYSGQDGALSLVHDSHGRRLRFSYTPEGLVKSVSGGDGRKYRYGYRQLYAFENHPTTLLAEVVHPDDTPLDSDDNPRVQYLYENPAFPAALTGVVDENGAGYATWTYDVEGRAASSGHAGGTDHHSVIYNVDGSRSVTGPLGKQTNYHFTTINGLPRVSQIERLVATNSAAATFGFGYDANGFLSSTTDWDGKVTNYVHDSRGLLTSMTEAVGTADARTTTTTWHNDFRVPAQIVAPRRTIDMAYDIDGLLTGRQVTDTTSHILPYSTNGQTRGWAYAYSDGGESPATPTPLPDVPLTLVNPGAETGDMTGWTVTQGGFTVRSAGPAPAEGSYYFYGGEDMPESRMHQDVAIPLVNESEVDGGQRAVRISWKHNTYQGGSNGTVVIRFLDASGLIIGDEFEYLRSSVTTWSPSSIAVNVPPLTRKIQVEVRAIRLQYVGNHSYFDDFAMLLEGRDPVRLPLVVQNADAETGGLSGWTSEAGAFQINFDNPLPAQGDYYFHPGAAAESRLSQDVQFSAGQFAAIDGGKREFEVTWRQYSLESADAGSVGIRFFDGSNAQIGPVVESPLIAPTWWQGQKLVEVVPPGARSVRITLRSVRGEGTTNNAYFDYVFANLIATDVPQLPLPRQVVSIDGPRGDVTDTTAFSYDEVGQLATVTNALGHMASITARDGKDLPLTLLDENGVETELSYDLRGRLIESRVKATAGDAVTTYAYDDAGLLTAVSLPDGNRVYYEYDAAQRLTAVANDHGERIEYTLDAMGNRTVEVLRAGSGTILRSQTRVFDELGRLLQSVGASSQTTAYGYDTNSNLTSITDPLSGTTAQAFDALDRLVQQTDPLSGITGYAYDAQDNLVSVTDPRGLVTTYTYNGFGDVIQLESPDTGATVFTLDAAGNVVSQIDARGVVTDFTYDALNRPLTRSYPATPAENVAYGYDDTLAGNRGVSRLTSVSDDSGSTSLSYDDYGNLVTESRTIGGVVYTTNYSFDVAGNLLQMTYPDGRIVSYGRDALGRVTSITTQSSASAAPVVVASDIAYQPFGPVASLTFGNGVVLTYSYDQDYRLTGITAGDGVNGVQNLTLAYDNADNITAITDLLDGTRSQTFQYDGLYRLIQAAGLYGTIDYGYDAVGNRTSRSIVDSLGTLNETYTYDTASNRLLSLSDGATTQSFSYSASGQIVADDRGAGTDLGFVYDDSDRLVQLQSAGLADTDYLHNAFGERVAKEVLGSSDITHFHYGQGGQLLGESDALGAFQRSYIYLDGLPIAQIEPVGGGATQADVTQDNADLGVLVQGNWTGASSLPGHEGTDYLVHPGAEPLPAGGTLLDNSSPAFSTTGLWPSASALPGFEGADYQSRSAGGPFAAALEVDNLDAAATIAGPWNLTRRTLGGHSGPNYLWREPNGVSPEAIYLDNAGPEFTETGYWLIGLTTAGGQFYGSDFEFIDHNSDGTDTIVVDNSSPEFSTTGPWQTATWQDGGTPFDLDRRWLYATDVSPQAILVDNMDVGFSTVGASWNTSTYTGYGRLVGPNIQWLNEQVVPPDAQVIDNTDAGAVAVGSWPISTNSSDRYGNNYFYNAAGSGNDTFTWTPTLAASGDYEVLAFWPNAQPNTTQATFAVFHAGGSTDVVVNQQTGGGRWVSLGTYHMEPASNHRVVLSDAASGGYVVADAIQIRPVGAVPNTAKWTPDILQEKEYRIYAWWSAASNRASDVVYTVFHAGGSTPVQMNQQQGGDGWNLLGTFTLSPNSNHRVELTNQANGVVMADAIQFFPVDATPLTATWEPDFQLAQDYKVYAWWTATSARAADATYKIHHAGGSSDVSVNQRSNGGQWNLLGAYSFGSGSNYRVELTNFARGSVDADAVKFVPVIPNPMAPPPTATWTPEITASREYAVYARWTAVANRATNATYKVFHGQGSTPVVVDQQQAGGQWNLLGTYGFSPLSNHRIELSNQANGRVSADAIMMVPTDGAPNSVTWTLNVPDNEYYKIETRWVTRDNRATNAPYTVNHAGGNDTIPVDQAVTWGTWVSLGSYLIPGDGSGSVVLTDQANGVVQADAVRLTADTAQVRTATWTYSAVESGDYRVFARWPVGEGQATDAKYTIQHAGGSSLATVSQARRGGQWNELGVFAFTGGQDYAITLSDDANGTVVADALYIVKVEPLSDAVTWTPSLPASGSYQVYAKWTADETRATDARYAIAHSGGTAQVSVNQRVGGGLWHYMGSYAFDPLSNPTVTLAANDNGSVAADAIRFVGGPGGATDVAYLHTDHLGTPQAMTDANAQVLWWRDQTPFGQTVTTGGFSQNPLRFPGQFADAESGLAYNYFRDYDPALGRYIQSDPIGLRGGLNTYGYVGGNPVSKIDRKGLAAIPPYTPPPPPANDNNPPPSCPTICRKVGQYNLGEVPKEWYHLFPNYKWRCDYACPPTGQIVTKYIVNTLGCPDIHILGQG
ncbi:RHS repeat-associated core domain-containing protein [Pelagibius sp. CAU 1746]|uniref:golvesin C-terminal-like domain-containing protein n=1 Tax=Pelagibius sp. CAU 1746 TaxID=3140370 RepID=UPI00325B20C5